VVPKYVEEMYSTGDVALYMSRWLLLKFRCGLLVRWMGKGDEKMSGFSSSFFLYVDGVFSFY